MSSEELEKEPSFAGSFPLRRELCCSEVEACRRVALFLSSLSASEPGLFDLEGPLSLRSGFFLERDPLGSFVFLELEPSGAFMINQNLMSESTKCLGRMRISRELRYGSEVLLGPDGTRRIPLREKMTLI